MKFACGYCGIKLSKDPQKPLSHGESTGVVKPLDENCKKPTRTRDDIFSLLILNFLSYGLCIADVGSIDCLHSILRPN